MLLKSPLEFTTETILRPPYLKYSPNPFKCQLFACLKIKIAPWQGLPSNRILFYTPSGFQNGKKPAPLEGLVWKP